MKEPSNKGVSLVGDLIPPVNIWLVDHMFTSRVSQEAKHPLPHPLALAPQTSWGTSVSVALCSPHPSWWQGPHKPWAELLSSWKAPPS